jgi:hypothetical protein
MARRSLASLLSLLTCIVTISGCGDSKAVVRGKVTYKNSPLTSGEVHFVGKSTSRSALIMPTGAYEMKDAPLGEVRVAVVSNKNPGKPFGPTLRSPQDSGPVPVASAIPSKYNDAKTSGLVFTISTGRQSIDIELKD